MTVNGLIKVALVFAQSAGVTWLAEQNRGWSLPPLTWQLSFAVAAVTLMTMIFLRRTKLEQGLLWTLAAMFLVSTISSKRSRISFVRALEASFSSLPYSNTDTTSPIATSSPDCSAGAFNSMTEQLGRTYTFAMGDVDHFKKFNDTYGHDVGDQVLKMVASRLSRVEGGGRVLRYGGEEFLVVFRGRSARDAQPFMESVPKKNR